MESFLDKLRYLFNPSKKVSLRTAVGIALLVTFGWELITGAAGNFVYDLYKNTVHPLLLTNIKFNYYELVSLLLVIVVLLAYVIALVRNQRKRLFGIRELNEFTNMLEEGRARLYWEMLSEINRICQRALDDKNGNRIEDVVGKIFKSLFVYLDVKIFQGGAIMLPDEKDKDVLKFWFMSPDQPLSPKRFNIGKVERIDLPRGTAGKVYLMQKPHIVKIVDREKGMADDTSFHNFGLDRPITPYAAFMALPIIWNNKAIGVLSIESQKKDGFSDNDTSYLEEIAKAIAGLLVNYGFPK
ncbi:MAG: GAF domain-containing protein [Anaerolineales bacterium]|nr:GAF domain-containing protein [Anaerolineales bacterium]